MPNYGLFNSELSSILHELHDHEDRIKILEKKLELLLVDDW